jgi:site-specific DNA recombinase
MTPRYRTPEPSVAARLADAEFAGPVLTRVVRIALYARVSTAKQADMYGLDAQFEGLRARAKVIKGGKVVAEFREDGVSGALMKRPELDRLRELVAKGGVDMILCPDVSRLARDVLLFLTLFDEFESRGVTVDFVGFPEGMTPSMRRFMLVTYANNAALERDQIRERTHERGKLVKARAGQWAGGRWPYGYRSTVGPDGRKKVLAIVPEQAREVVRMFEAFDERTTLRQIVADLAARKVPTGRSAARWYPEVVRAILRNPGYMGRGRYNTTKNPSKAARERNPALRTERRPESEWLTVEYPAIVGRALFDRVQARLRSNAEVRRGRPGNPARFLKGFLVCGDCGRRLSAKGSGRSFYYECPTLTHHRDMGVDPCRGTVARRARVEEFEALVWETVAGIYTVPARLRVLCDNHRKATAVSDVEAQSAVIHARSRVAKADTMVSKWVRVIDRDDDPTPEALAALDAAKAERTEARASLAVAEERVANLPALTDEELAAFSKGITKRVRGTADPEDKAAVLRDVLTRIVVNWDAGTLTFEGPLMAGLVKAGDLRRLDRYARTGADREADSDISLLTSLSSARWS